MRDVADVERRWRQAEARFESNGYRGPAEAPEFEVRTASRLGMVCAIHAVKHWRTGRLKGEDQGTGGLATALAEWLGWSSVVVLRDDPTVEDPNSSEAHPIKQYLAEQDLPRPGGLLVDLHGMTFRRDLDISIGIGSNDGASERLASAVASELILAGFDVDLGAEKTGLRARSPGTMTSWAQRRNVAAIQVEIAPQWRSRIASRTDRQALLNALHAGLAAAERLTGRRDGPS